MSDDAIPASGLPTGQGQLPPPERRPRHIAFIMDGNGRWAESQGQPRAAGHARGADTVEWLVEETARLGLEQITLYCFSRENWKRPEAEQAFLFELLERYVIDQRPRIRDQGLRFETIGDLSPLPQSVRTEIATTRQLAARNDGMLLCLALNYGGRQEIVDAARRLARGAVAGMIDPADLDDEMFSSALDTAGMIDPDLVIRTAGEMRVSNFLLWQISYAEIWVTEKCWPEFDRRDLHQAIHDFANRKRRYGGLPEPA